MDTAASRQPDTTRSILYALGANVAIGASKMCGALLTGSGALLAESFHSLADTGNEVLLLLGRRQAKLRPSARHPLGHGRETYFWSFVVTILLFSVGGIFSIYEGVHKVYEPVAIEKPWVAVGIVLFAMLAEGVSLRTVLAQVAKVRGQRNLWSWFRETRRSELIVVLGEDLAAIAGLALALPALLLTMATGNTIYDAVGSVAIGLLLMIVASGLAIEIKSLLIGESASPGTRRAIRRFLNSRPQILEIGQLVTLQHGDDLIVAVTAHMKQTGVSRELVGAIAECKAGIQAEFPQIRWIFFEPINGESAARKKANPFQAMAKRPRSPG
jgi:cation diffusion facilitator family transporter